MTQSVMFFFSVMSIWSIIFVVILLAVVLFILLIVVPKYSENVNPRKQKEYKPTRNDMLISFGIGIIMFCLIVIILTIVLVIIGNNLSEEVINCFNCTGLNFLT